MSPGDPERAMSSDEARDLFSDALEGTLDPERRRAFDQALAEDAALREEWEAFCAVMRAVASLGAEDEAAPAPDLLPKVQSKLRRRSRGRFYRDRFAEGAGQRLALPLLAAIMVALLLASAWVATQSLIVIEAPPSGGARPHPAAPAGDAD
jgi:anti-sigma factor RsiW